MILFPSRKKEPYSEIDPPTAPFSVIQLCLFSFDQRNNCHNRIDQAPACPDSQIRKASGHCKTNQRTDGKKYDQKGETAEIDDIQITLQNVTEMNEISVFSPAEEKVFLVLEFELANNSKEDFAMSSLMCLEAYCDRHIRIVNLLPLPMV